MDQHSPLIIDIAGTQLTAADRRRLRHPLVGGLILFARNWENRAQLVQLVAEIKALRGDLLMLVAIAVCGLGYAEGAHLSRRLGGWQVISWALVLALPAMLLLTWWALPASLAQVRWPAWLGLGYVALFSMLIGFVFWYRGLAQGGIAAVGQLQLLQPFIGLGLAALLLHEAVNPAMLAVTLGTVLCVAGAKKYAT